MTAKEYFIQWYCTKMARQAWVLFTKSFLQWCGDDRLYRWYREGSTSHKFMTKHFASFLHLVKLGEWLKLRDGVKNVLDDMHGATFVDWHRRWHVYLWLVMHLLINLRTLAIWLFALRKIFTGRFHFVSLHNITRKMCDNALCCNHHQCQTFSL